MICLKNISFPLLLLIQLLFSHTVNSEIYKSIDENNRVTYSNKPVTENAKELEIKKTPIENTISKERYEKQRKLLEVMQEERDQKLELEQKAQEEIAQQDALCAKTRDKLQEYKESSFLYKESEDPDNPIIATDEERSAAEKKLERLIKNNC